MPAWKPPAADDGRRRMQNHSEIAEFLWKISGLVKDDYDTKNYADVILPFTPLRRLDCVLRPTRQAVREAAEKSKTVPAQTRDALLTRADIEPNFSAYLDGFSANVKDILYNIPFDDALAKAEAGQIDFLPCLSRTPERSKCLLFTEPYISYPFVIVTRENAPIVGSVKDLDGKSLAVVKHLVVYSKLRNEYPDLNIDYFFTRKVEENLEAVSSRFTIRVLFWMVRTVEFRDISEPKWRTKPRFCG